MKTAHQIHVLLQHMNCNEVARQCDVHGNVVRGIKNDPDFNTAYINVEKLSRYFEKKEAKANA